MIDLLDKHKGIIERFDRMLQLGVNAMGPTNDQILSPTRAIIQGRETILAGTNNYMGMTFTQSAIDAGKRALDEFGTGTTGSRVANGNYAMHTELEKELAKFLNKQHCIVFTTGYQANLGMMSGLAGPRDTIYLDSDSHSSIYDGCTLSGAKLVRFRHNDAADLDKRLSRSEGEEGGRLVVLEGIYSMLGDRAPLKEFVEVKKKHGFQLLVDEAHSFGVLGDHGRGLADEVGLEDEADFVVGTFSKSVDRLVALVLVIIRCLKCCAMRCGLTCSQHHHRLPPLQRLWKQSACWRASLNDVTASAPIRSGCSMASRRWALRWGVTWSARLSPSNARTRFQRFRCGMRSCRPVFTSTSPCHRARRTVSACCAVLFQQRIVLMTSTRSSMCSARW